MLGALRTSTQPYTLSGAAAATGSPSPEQYVSSPWAARSESFHASDPTAAAPPPAPPESAASSGGLKMGLVKRISVVALGVAATLSGTSVVLSAASAAEPPSVSQVVQTTPTTAVVHASKSESFRLFDQAVPGARLEGPSLTESLMFQGPVLAILPPDPFSRPRVEPLAVPLGGLRRADTVEPQRSGAGRTYPRTAVAKGDYVAHGVNFSTLLSNEEFTDASSLDRAQIQGLLERSGSFLASYTQDGRSAAQIIHEAAAKYEINPRVILATLEKENSLVSRESTPPGRVLRSAMGYGYDDGGGKAGKRSSFAWQVDNGTRVLRAGYDEGLALTMPMRIRVDYRQRKIRVNNAATYALMKYTPHTRDTQLRQIGGGNYLFRNVMRRVNFQVEKLEQGQQTAATPTNS